MRFNPFLHRDLRGPEPKGSPKGLPTCKVAQALQAGGEVALGALGVPQVQGLQGRESWELPARRHGWSGQMQGQKHGSKRV